MRNRAFLKVVLLGLLTLAFAPGYAAAAGQGQDLTEMLASSAATRAAAVSGPVIAVAPLSLDFGTVDNGATATQFLTVRNTGDQTLTVTGVASTGSSAIHVSPGTTFPFNLAPGGAANVAVDFTPTDGTTASTSLTFQSNATNGDFTVAASGQGNAPPVLDPIGDKAVTAFQTLSFTVTGSDANDTLDDEVTFSMTGLPTATFNTVTGEFSWTPTAADAGDHLVTFEAHDGRLSDSETITITVTVTNNLPTADAGGSYIGATGQPVQFDGTGSSDPDPGQTLTYTWNFGDGFTGTGPTPVHTYGADGSYIVTLEVCDNGSPVLCDSDTAPVTIQDQVTVQVMLKNFGTILRTNGGGRELVGIEEVQVSYTQIIPSSIRMSTDYPGAGTVSEIGISPKGTPKIGDMDLDGVADYDVYFTRADIRALFANVPNNTTVNMIITGSFQTATGTIPFRGVLVVTIKGGSGAVSASAFPNPFNPETMIAVTLKSAGPLSMRIYSIDGRLVRTLKDGEVTAAGTHEVRWNGLDNRGDRVPSGVYFFKASVNSETSVFKLSVMK